MAEISDKERGIGYEERAVSRSVSPLIKRQVAPDLKPGESIESVAHYDAPVEKEPITARGLAKLPIGIREWTIRDQKGKISHAWVEPIVEAPNNQEPPDIPAVERGVVSTPKIYPRKPKIQTQQKREISKPLSVDKNLKRIEQAKVDLKKAPYIWKIQDILDAMKELDTYLKDPWKNNFEAQISYWKTRMGGHGPSISAAGFGAAAKMIAKIRQKEEELRDLQEQLLEALDQLSLIGYEKGED